LIFLVVHILHRSRACVATDRQTDRQTDKQTDRQLITPSPVKSACLPDHFQSETQPTLMSNNL